MRMEALLNAFVRFVALLERTGNALGTLGFVWASVVVLGGFSNNLGDDFWVATVIVFLEAFRAFSRQSRSDDQFLFKTTGGIKLKRVALASSSSSLYYVNAVILTVCLWMLPTQYIIVYHLPRSSIPGYDGFVILFVLVMVEKLRFYKFIGYMSTKESHILLQLSPAAAIPLIALARYYLERHHRFGWKFCILISQWFTVYTLARFGSPGDHTPFHRGVKAAAKLLRGTVLCTTTLQLSLNFKEPMGFVILVGPLFLGNLQTPLALARIILSWGWLFRREIEVYETDNENVKLAVKVLYIMVMCQGILYMAACILESISFLPRRSLALGCGLVDKLGMESVDLYYEQAYDTFLQERLFDTTKEMGLVTFAVDSLNSDASWEKKRAAVRILDSFLQRHRNSSSSNTEIVSLITTSTKAVKTLISMLGWTVPKDADIRLFATKVTTQLAPHLRIVGIPGTMQMVSSLLDAQDELEREDISTRTVEGIGGNVDNHQISNGSSSPRDIEGGHTPGVQISSVQATRNSKRCCLVEWICRSLQYVEDLQSVPQEDSKDMELLLALGMQILEGLAHDLHNCAEIGRATQILQKVIGFISCITGITTVKREKIGTPSLRLVARLASVTGQIGITLRQELSKNPFLIGNLAEILVFEDSSSYLEQSQLAMDIIAKLAKDKNTRQKIGRIQVIIDKLVQEFLGEDEPRKRRRAAAGKALAILARESLENCSAMLKDEPDYVLIADLANKLQGGEHVYTAASLLQILCKNCREVMCTQGPSDHLLSTLKGVMGGIVDAEGKQMDALIGLASQLCGVLSEKITPVLESFQNDETFVEKLVDELNAHKKPTPDESPNIRTMLVGLTISILEFCPRYGSIFREHRMVEALSKVEQYMVLYGSGRAGVVIGEPTGDLPTLVARAKLLIDANIAPV